MGDGTGVRPRGNGGVLAGVAQADGRKPETRVEAVQGKGLASRTPGGQG